MREISVILQCMKKEKYLDRIIPLLKGEGLSLSMDSIADKIGVTRKTLYNNFSSKDELLKECCERLLEEFRQMTVCLTDTKVPVEKGFRDGVLGLYNFFRTASHVFTRDMMQLYPELAYGSHNSGSVLFEERLRENIMRGQKEGVYRKDIDTRWMAHYIAFAIFGFFQKYVMGGRICTPEEYFAQVTDFMLHGLKI